MFQDFSEQRDMTSKPTNAPSNTSTSTSYIPMQQPDGAAGFTANKPDTCTAPCAPPAPAPHHHPAPQPPPPSNESKTFCPTESKPGDADSNKAYGTFRGTPPPVPGSVAANSAFRKDSGATTEQNNATGNWTTMSQTTIILGADGNTSVQPGSTTVVLPRCEACSVARGTADRFQSLSGLPFTRTLTHTPTLL
uniref:Uncharacterized protein n=1 Tax=Gouania willdenowi TaxID=441366 RepID=A0A8C5EMI5_GOUWI